MTSEPPAPPPKRKPFAAIRKGIIEHVIGGRLQGLRFAIYIWLHLLADHTRGTARTNAARVASDLGLHPVTTRRHLAALKRDGYIRYASMTGREQLYEITIEKFHAHFESAGVALQGSLQGVLQGSLHRCAGTSRKIDANTAPKNKEERSKETASALRAVRSADVTGTEEVSLTRSDARAQASAPAREALDLFFETSGRSCIGVYDFAYFGLLDQAHTPAVISKGILAAAARFARQQRNVGELTLQYVWESLKHFTTRKAPAPESRRGEGARGVAPGSSERPKYPPGVTPLRW